MEIIYLFFMIVVKIDDPRICRTLEKQGLVFLLYC
ncbi:unnamed protein product [Onchocerca flexuosa]|uniref:Uncharacterized protein n=1 Tax=Onchocerca flexuosa TaxID=387005 RepID=A0A183I0U6_9BILA|nr:unnamed protein product [Onchocerca flexuosa]